MDKVGVGIVGCGVISEIYMQNLKEKFQIINLLACSDLSKEKMYKRAEQFHIKAVSYEQMLSDPEIDMIINLTNPVAHYSLTRQALNSKKHVFSEKMMSVTLEEGQELLTAAEKNGVYLGVAPDTFLGGSIQTSRYAIDKGLIGEPLSAIVSINRDFTMFGDIFPHMHKAGGTVAYDLGCYYMTALLSVFGPVREITAFADTYNKERVSRRVDRPWFGEEIFVEDFNVITAVLRLENGMLITVHFNAESIVNENPHMEIYGTEGILFMGDPNTFDDPVYIQKPFSEKVQFPFTHGYLKNSRGVGAAEMAWSIKEKRMNRAGSEMAYHVLEVLHGMSISAETGRIYRMQSAFVRPEALPAGYIDNGFWGPCEESALV